MKMMWCVLMVGLMLSSCKKSNNSYEPKMGRLEPSTGIGIIRHPPFAFLPVCIRSYSQFYNLFGTNVLTVKAVILESGVRYPAGAGTRSITYRAVDTNEPHSLFRSRLLIVYDVSGYPQSSFQDVWTLGCVYENSGVPPFTNIVWRNRVYEINTSFWFGAPALGIPVEKIKFLVVE